MECHKNEFPQRRDWGTDSTMLNNFLPGYARVSMKEALSGDPDDVNLFGAIPRRPLMRKPVCRGTYECSRLCRVYQLDLLDPMIAKIPRGGIVYYTFENGELYFCFGRDRTSGDLTDFGGGRRGLEDPVECAVREGNEESRFVFGQLTPQSVQWFWCLYNSQMLIIFVHVATRGKESIFDLTARNFQSAQMVPNQYIRIKGGTIVISRCCDEVSEMVWLNERRIDDILSDSSRIKLYARVRRFIRSCPQFQKPGRCIRDWLLQLNPGETQLGLAC
jgi:hypothetical protein